MGNIPWLNEMFEAWYEVTAPYLQVIWEIVATWWWLPLPFILYPIFKFHWRFWRVVVWLSTENPMTLIEIRLPSENLKPMRAMETVLTGLWQVYVDPNWFEKYWKGEDCLSFSLEIAAIEGVPHFLMRIPEKQRDVFETHIYAQYPDAEIEEVEDYTKKVPQDIPNKEWDVWGTDYTMVKDDCYPIKIYTDFESERETKEEKRIDPISALMEGLSKLGPGEQIWIQIGVRPVTNLETGFFDKAKAECQKIAGRKAPSSPKSILREVGQEIIKIFLPEPKVGEEKAEEEAYPEMKLTSGEKEILKGIEHKMSKHVFKTFIRYVYVTKRDSFQGGRPKIPMSYFNEFNTNNMNMMIPWGKTITKVKQNWYDWFWFRERRLYTKKRSMFRNYINRDPAFDPLEVKGATYHLSTSELATIFHFPSRTVSPPSAISRVDAKKREAPYDLPVEE